MFRNCRKELRVFPEILHGQAPEVLRRRHSLQHRQGLFNGKFADVLQGVEADRKHRLFLTGTGCAGALAKCFST